MCENKEETLTQVSSSNTDYETEDESQTIDHVDLDAPMKPKPPSLMCLMKSIFKEEVANVGADDRKFLTIAIHAIMLEAGFVCFDPISGKKIGGFGLPNRWASATFTTILVCYTLPEVLERCSNGNGSSAIEKIVLKFQNLGFYSYIYGSLVQNGCVVHGLRVKQNHFIQPLELAFVDSELIDARVERLGYCYDLYPECEVLEFKKMVNDALVYPLLIDICERTGLLLPPCFMRLPAELKFKILELLHGVDIAKVACVCSELRDMCYSTYLWKQKLTKEFGYGLTPGSSWRHGFAMAWNLRNKREKQRIRLGTYYSHVRRNPNSNRVPKLISIPAYILN